jgi:signal transduction histidine kinase
MDVSRIAQGRIQLEKCRIDLGALVSHAVEAIGPLITERRHQLHIELPSEPLMVEGDEVRLTQVVSNLLHNAAKYTGSGGMIWVSADRDRDQAIIRVRDNGPGIPREKLGTIFAMFSQLESTLKRAHGGLGIGLFLARQVVELHHGQIEARSDGPGTGAEFIVSLPCRYVTQQQAVAVASPVTSNRGA